MPEYVKRDIIFPGSDYNWIDLPKDAVITNVMRTGGQTNVYYTSDYPKEYKEGEGGFEFFSFREGQDVEINMSTVTSTRKCVYAKVEKTEGRNLLIIICKWEKK